ncbi:MAG TPA: hypothetical protein VF524_00795 [Polyangia bacterium]
MHVIRAKFWVYQHSGIMLMLLVAITGAGLFFVHGSTGTFAVTTVGAILSLAYFLQKQKLDEIRLFKELFVDFNRRYEDLNKKLATVKDPEIERPLTPDEMQTLVAYFNLCAEEYLFQRRGYIHPDAWKAWRIGMRDIFGLPRIREFWKRESGGTDSYYGLEQEIRILLEDTAKLGPAG